SAHVSLGLEGKPPLRPGRECEIELPVVLTLGGKVVRIQGTPASSAIQSLETPTDFPLRDVDRESPFTTLDLQSAPVPDVTGIIGWLRAMIRVLQSAASDADFFQKGAQAVVEVVRLDLGRV